MQLASFEASWPVLSAIKWSRQYHAMLATPLRVGDIVLGHQAFIAARMLMTATVYLVVIAILMPFFDSSVSPLGILAIPVTVLVGIAYAAPIAAWGAHTENEASFVAIFRFVILPMFLFSGTFFPISELPASAGGDRLPDAALAWRRPLPPAHARGGHRRERDRPRRLPAGLDRARPRRSHFITYRRRLSYDGLAVSRGRVLGAAASEDRRPPHRRAERRWSTAGPG